MLIEQYELRVESPPWEPGSEHRCAFVQLKADISAALPYLNAVLKGALYEQSLPALYWRTEGRLICFHARQIAVSDLADRDDAQNIAERLVQLVNQIWEQRDQIQPSQVRRERPQVLTVYKLLPRKNCKACGQSTCFTFALKLIAGQVDVTYCGPLFEEVHREQRERLLQLLEAAGITTSHEK
ncbi:MAG: Fe-S cluster protein [Chloroflexi bacterium]|nr:Fe-S cluster protein [Chloroflexota bacterium]